MCDFEQRNIKDLIKAKEEQLGYDRIHLRGVTHLGIRRVSVGMDYLLYVKVESRSKWLLRTALIVSALETGQCSLPCYLSRSCPGELLYPVTPHALFVTACQVEKQGPEG